MKTQLGIALVICSFCTGLNSVRAETFSDFALGISNNDNISNAQLDPEIFSDRILKASYNLGKFVDLDDGLSITWLAGVEYFDYDEWPGFNHLDITGKIDLKKKTGLGAFVPSIGAQLSLAQLNYDEDVRDRLHTQLEFYWSKRINESWDMGASLNIIEASADNELAAGPSGIDTGPGAIPGMARVGYVYDISQQLLSLSAGLALGEAHYINFSASLMQGDVISSAIPYEEIVNISTAISPDAAMGDGFFAYRIDANTKLLSLSWDYSINDDYSVNFSYEYRDSKANEGPVYYKTNITSLNLTVLL